MEQLSLFNSMDEVRFATSLTVGELFRLKVTNVEAFHRIKKVRDIVDDWNAMCRHADRQYRYKLADLGITW